MFRIFKKKKKVLEATAQEAAELLDELDDIIKGGRAALDRASSVGFRRALCNIEMALETFHDKHVTYK